MGCNKLETSDVDKKGISVKRTEDNEDVSLTSEVLAAEDNSLGCNKLETSDVDTKGISVKRTEDNEDVSLISEVLAAEDNSF